MGFLFGKFFVVVVVLLLLLEFVCLFDFGARGGIQGFMHAEQVFSHRATGQLVGCQVFCRTHQDDLSGAAAGGQRSLLLPGKGLPLCFPSRFVLLLWHSSVALYLFRGTPSFGWLV